MSELKTIISRTQLYERVWTTPMQKLAQEFGLSDVGLAKLCRRYEIPLPGRGYWARIQFGQKPARTPLFDATRLHTENITIYGREPHVREALASGAKEQVLKIEVAADRVITHPVVCRIAKSITKASTDERGMLLARPGLVVPVRVSEPALPRGLRILDALFTAADAAGYTLDWPKPYNTQVKILVLGEQLTISLTEAVDRNEHKLTREEIARQKKESWWRPPQWDQLPSGRLRITLESCEYSYLQHSWKDGKRRKLEDCVGKILSKCGMTAEDMKRERKERAETERRRIEEQRQQAEKAARKAEYDRKAEAVKKLAHAWKARSSKNLLVHWKDRWASADVPESEAGAQKNG